MRDYAFKAVPAGETRIIHAPTGDFFRVKDSPVDLFVELETIDGDRPAQLTLQETGYFRMPARRDYQLIRMRNDGAEAADFVVTLGKGETGDNLLSGDVSTVTRPAATMPGGGALTMSAGANSIAGNANRREIILRSNPDNTGKVWLGTAVDNGIPLFPGDTMILQVSGEIDLWAESAGDKLYWSEIV